MLGIYLLVTIFAQFSPTIFSPDIFWSTPMLTQPLEVTVNFDELNDIRVGTPVLSDGHIVGSVSKISYPDTSYSDRTYSNRATPDNDNFQVGVTITPPTGLPFHQGIVALQTSLMSVTKSSPETVVELLFLPGADSHTLQGGSSISGFSSMEKFWTAGQIRSKKS
jgi:hypothetical protein